MASSKEVEGTRVTSEEGIVTLDKTILVREYDTDPIGVGNQNIKERKGMKRMTHYYCY